MRAHFAGLPTTPESVDKIEAVSMETRIMEFKQDAKNMEILTEFIDEVLQKAELEANQQKADNQAIKSQQQKDKSRQSFSIPDFKNGKVVNRARGFVVKLFDAICNCANNAAAVPTQRFKLRSKRHAPAATTTAAGSEDIPEATTNTELPPNSKELKKANIKISGDTDVQIKEDDTSTTTATTIKFNDDNEQATAPAPVAAVAAKV